MNANCFVILGIVSAKFIVVLMRGNWAYEEVIFLHVKPLPFITLQEFRTSSVTSKQSENNFMLQEFRDNGYCGASEIRFVKF